MTFRHIVAAAAALLTSLSPALAADPVVLNLTAAQRPGTKLVDITYDVTADTPTVKVTLEISSDGGATYSVPVTTVSGAVGNSVSVGISKTITWNAGADWDGKFSPQTRFRVLVDDLQLPALAGLSGVSAGALPASSWAGAQSVAAFYMGKTEVTWAEFQTVRTWAAANGYDIGSVGAGTGPNRPVTNVSWYQTLKWCNARSEKEGLRPVYKVGSAVYRTGDSVPTVDATANGYRLPSEKEWEFAARGGVNTNGYEYSGSNDINAVAWYSVNSGMSTNDVAKKLANELGISDMSGNAWEWCFDNWDSSGPNRVVRGGSWGNDASVCRVVSRYSFIPGLTNEGFGFRVVRSSAMIQVETGALPASSELGAQAVSTFEIARTEVTWSEWQTVRSWAAANGYDIGTDGAGTGPNRPVTNVSWYHAIKWCNARSEIEGLTPVYRLGSHVYRTGDLVPTIDATANGYRLPSEKEWEFAARGGVKTNGYEYSGSDDCNAVAWYSINSGSSTQDVATKLANELGLSDMSGNVWEWCFDASDSGRVTRGGSWGVSDAIYCSVAFRYTSDPTRSNSVAQGFRVARSSVSTGAVGNAVTKSSAIDTRDWPLTVTTPVNGTVNGAVCGDD